MALSRTYAHLRERYLPLNLNFAFSNVYLVFRVFSAIIFGGTQLGRAAASAPDFSKAKDSAARIFRLLDRIPAYADPYSEEGLIYFLFKLCIKLKY